jgi:hypothetical protein
MGNSYANGDAANAAQKKPNILVIWGMNGLLDSFGDL